MLSTHPRSTYTEIKRLNFEHFTLAVLYIIITVTNRLLTLLRPRQNGPYLINDNPALVQIMAWHYTGDMPFSELIHPTTKLAHRAPVRLTITNNTQIKKEDNVHATSNTMRCIILKSRFTYPPVLH